MVDAEQNYYTVRYPLISQANVQLTPETFATRVNAITQTIVYVFDEAAFEQTIYALMLNYMALRDGSVAASAPAFFQSLAEETVTYLANTFMIDDRLGSVESEDRRRLIRQHVIDVINAISMTSNGVSNAGLMFSLLNQTINGQFYLGDTLPEVALKIYQSIFFITDV